MKVSICCITYNHEKFIADTLNGFLMQQYDNDWEIVIHDDASTDNTVRIVESYQLMHGNRIRLISNKTNIGMTANFIQAIKSCHGEFISFCEGDDYWTDPFKLKKQTTILDENSGCSIVWSNFMILKGHELQTPPFNLPFENNLCRIELNNIFEPYVSLMLTAMVRKSVLCLEAMENVKYFRDNSLYVMALIKGFGYHMNVYTGVYRLHEGGAHSLQSKFKKSLNNYLSYKEIIRIFPSIRSLKRFQRIKEGELINSYMYFISEKKYKNILSSDTRTLIKNIFTRDTFKLLTIVLRNPSKLIRVIKRGGFYCSM